MSDVHKSSLVAGIEELFQSGRYSGLTIRCGTEEWKVHRSVICQRSKFFAAAYKGDFKVSHARCQNPRIALRFFGHKHRN